jgi:NAD(P)-dependent dehydrogenase (short-subunit alcohol dehydrogenase family)
VNVVTADQDPTSPIDWNALPSFSLTGQAAVVTGASGGIGRVIAAALSNQGVRVVLADLESGPLDALAAEIAAHGGEAVACVTDVTQPDDCAAMVQSALDRFSRLDLIVNNAVFRVNKPALELTVDDWDRVMAVNVKGVFLGAQAAARLMIERGGGSIVNLASQFGVVADLGRANYIASKHAVVGLTRALALEWAPHQIRVNAIGPAVVPTPPNRRYLVDETARNEVLTKIPLGRLGTPSDVAGAVLYLASPAASWITGHTLLVDGGWTAR